MVGGTSIFVYCVDFQNDVFIPSQVYSANITPIVNGRRRPPLLRCNAFHGHARKMPISLDEWLEDGPVALIVTSGSDGARVFRRGEAPVHARSFQVPIADTIGAGDTFSAATIVALLERGSATPQAVSSLSTPEWTDVLRFAAAAAALNCTRSGADPPTRRELRDFLDSARVPNHAQLASDDLPVRQGRHQRRK